MIGLASASNKVLEVEKEDLTFSVDSALWEELGERLVGRSSTALAELVKNSYDADATNVAITLDPKKPGLIVVDDNGHGMNHQEFKEFWMRVGSAHKKHQQTSRYLGRPLTGSKGVGRIAARLLSHDLKIITVPRSDKKTRIVAHLNWQNASRVKELTQAKVHVEVESLEKPAESGTRIEMQDLKSDWEKESVKAVAQEIWQLQPPFPDPNAKRDKRAFRVVFQSPDGDLTSAFDDQMQAALTLWEAKVVGELRDGDLKVSLWFREDDSRESLKRKHATNHLRDTTFEIRVFRFQRKQQKGILVGDAREYLQDFSGVHIYDSGFRLPYYGTPEADWLRLTLDHARRIGMSEYLPELNVPGGLLHLPHISHLIGAVHVQARPENDLEVTITRDRLKETAGFEELAKVVRMALDFYAIETTKRQLKLVEERLGAEKPSVVLKTVEDVIDHYAGDLGKPAVKEMKAAVKRALVTNQLEEQRQTLQIAVLSSLATAGMSVVAFQHELTKQLLVAEKIVERLGTLEEAGGKSAKDIGKIRKDMSEWMDRTRTLGNLFSHLGEAENVRQSGRFSVERVVHQTIAHVQPLLPGITFKSEIEPRLSFPAATYAEWVSLLQNVIFNAANAMQRVDTRRLRFSAHATRNRATLTIEDTGTGVDVDQAERLFRAFERGSEISNERKAAGFGGTGLGLTIVRMIAERRGCTASFVKPSSGFATAFQLAWEVKA